METFKSWHSSHNLLWLKCDNHLNQYSSFQAILACLHPIIVLFAIIVYVIFTTGLHEGDTQHFVTFKDAKPHWRVEDHYYNHMATELNFTILNNHVLPPPFKLSQYYPNSGCPTQMQCAKLIENNHNFINLGSQDINKIIEFEINSTNQELKANGILCYTERVNNYYEHGLILCNNHQYTVENSDESVIVSVESKEQHHLFELEMKKDTSYIVTVQLWINYKGNGKWEGNEINVINIEEMKSKQFRIPILNDGYGEEERCYGLKVIQDRIVYEIEDGMNLKRFFVNQFWFIMLVYFISLCGLRGINWIFANKSSGNNVNVKCVPNKTTDDGEKNATDT